MVQHEPANEPLVGHCKPGQQSALEVQDANFGKQHFPEKQSARQQSEVAVHAPWLGTQHLVATQVRLESQSELAWQVPPTG